MAQTVYLVSYDIGDPDRLRKVFKVMKGAGEWVQYSVFRCTMSDKVKEMLVADLDKIIVGSEDQVLFVDLGPEGGRSAGCITYLGRPYKPAERKALIL